MLIALRVQLNIPDPKNSIFLCSDASKVQLSFNIFEVTGTSEFKLILSDSKIIKVSVTKSSAVEREFLALQFMLMRGEVYISSAQKRLS